MLKASCSGGGWVRVNSTFDKTPPKNKGVQASQVYQISLIEGFVFIRGKRAQPPKTGESSKHVYIFVHSTVPLETGHCLHKTNDRIMKKKEP